jgi:hypothetical protein
MNNIKKNVIISLAIIVVFVSFALIANAQVEPIVSGPAQSNDPLTITALIELAVRVAKFIWGISGSVALIFFMYGGFTWLTSAGSPERVTQGKTIFKNAIIGLLLIFGSWVIINFAFMALLGKEKAASTEWFKSGWFGQNSN